MASYFQATCDPKTQQSAAAILQKQQDGFIWCSHVANTLFHANPTSAKQSGLFLQRLLGHEWIQHSTLPPGHPVADFQDGKFGERVLAFVEYQRSRASDDDQLVTGK